MPEVAELPVIGWITQRFRGKPQSTVETPPLISPPPESTVQLKPPTMPPTPVTVQGPKLSREERRAGKKEEYLKWKVTQRAEPKSPSLPVARPEISPPPLKTEARPVDLPSGIKKRERFPEGLLITETEIPWLRGDRVQVALEKMTLDTSQGQQFLYGSLIYGRKLRRLFNQLAPRELRNLDDLLFVQLSELIQDGFAPDIEIVHHRITKKTNNKPIFETGNQNGGRVYFMRFDEIQGLPVIIRIAAAKDHKIEEVFSVICKERG